MISWRTIPKGFFLLSAAIGLIFAWVVLSGVSNAHEHPYVGLAITIATFVLLGALAQEHLAPELSVTVKWLLIVGLIVKIALSVWYFDSHFVTRIGGNSVAIATYGDSYIHHNLAVMLMTHWSAEFLNPIAAADLPHKIVYEWGYGYFLSMLYSVTGPKPETGIIANGLLMFLTCLMGHRLFLLAGVSRNHALVGLTILFINPIFWLWSSLLYKDSLLYLIVVSCTTAILQLIQGAYWRLPVVIVLLLALVPIRYAYTIPLVALLSFGCFYLRPSNLRYAFLLFAVGCANMYLLNAAMSFFGVYHNVIDAASGIVGSTPVGGRLLSSILGAQPTVYSFMYTLPIRAAYILTIPMPWFGGQSVQEQIDFVLSHVDAAFYYFLVAAITLKTFSRSSIPGSKIRWLLFGMGLLYFVMPLLFFSPSRRYVSLPEIFFIAYIIPHIRPAVFDFT